MRKLDHVRADCKRAWLKLTKSAKQHLKRSAATASHLRSLQRELSDEPADHDEGANLKRPTAAAGHFRTLQREMSNEQPDDHEDADLREAPVVRDTWRWLSEVDSDILEETRRRELELQKRSIDEDGWDSDGTWVASPASVCSTDEMEGLAATDEPPTSCR